MEQREIRARIDDAIAQLSPEHRAVILMKETEDMQYHEIAEALGCSIGTVMSRLSTPARSCRIYCEIFMKTFEEKWTAWLDGELSGDELVEFEASLPDRAAAEAEKRDAHKLGAFLKEQLQVARWATKSFSIINCASGSRAMRRGKVPQRRRAQGQLCGRLPLVWVGATSLAIFCVCTFFVMRRRPN